MRRFAAILLLTALTVVMAPSAAAGGGCHWNSDEWTADSSTSDEVIAHIAGCRYEPTTLSIEPGTTVTWINKDPVPHSVTGPFLTLNSDRLLGQGDEASVTFDEEGVYPYYCVLHPGMAASVIVGEPTAAAMGAMGASGTYDVDAPVKGSAEEVTEASDSSSSMVPIAAGGGVALLAVAAGALLLKRRRRALPVPGALP